MKKTDKDIYLLIDSHALLHRAYHAMPYLQAKDGTPSGALFGLTFMILNAIEKFQPKYIFAGNDLPKETFRAASFKEYKANRKEGDEALKEQIVLMPKVFEAFGISLWSKEGYEADDIIATLTKEISKKDKNSQIIIFTGDMDLMQLVDGERVVVYTGKKGEEDLLYSEDEVFKKYSLYPRQIPDYKGLRGDTSDNIPGIKGIGEKTATQILAKGGSIENIYELIREGKSRDFFELSERFFELLKNGEEEAQFSRELARVNTEVEFEHTLSEYNFEENKDKLINLSEEYNFLSLRKRLVGGVKPVDKKDLNEFVKIDVKEVAEGEVGEERGEELGAAAPRPAETQVQSQIEFSKLGLRKAKMALWVLDSQEGDADEARLGYVTKKTNEKDILEYLEKQIIKEGLETIYNEIELPLIPILDEANKIGVKVDRVALTKLLKRYEKEREEISAQIFELAGETFNLNSPKQLGQILFTKLNIQGKMKKTGKGNISTRADVLEDLKEEHAIIPLVLQFREREKMVNTYLEPLLVYSQFDERIHTTFVQTGAQTGRFSSVNPNMQNIPVRGEEGVELRKCFVASEGKVLVAADYSQIELRIAAMLSKEEYLKDIFVAGGDIHKSVAMKMFKKTESEITKEERNAAKAMNFGIIYGMGVNSIKNTLKVERNVAQAFYDSYTIVLPSLMKYLKDTIKVAKDKGYTETLFGRRRNIPELFSSIPMVRASGERFAMNAPIQGTSADIIKLAMSDFKKVCEEKKWGVDKISFLLQVHDELIYEVDEGMTEEVGAALSKSMENVLLNHRPIIDFLDVPVVANVKMGKNWGEM